MCSVESRSIYPVAGQDMLSKAIWGKKTGFQFIKRGFGVLEHNSKGLKKEFQNAEDHAQQAECSDTNVCYKNLAMTTLPNKAVTVMLCSPRILELQVSLPYTAQATEVKTAHHWDTLLEKWCSRLSLGLNFSNIIVTKNSVHYWRVKRQQTHCIPRVRFPHWSQTQRSVCTDSELQHLSN